MKNWVTKIWLPFLLMALVVAVYFETSSVKTIDLDTGYSASGVSEPQVRPLSPGKRPAQQKNTPRIKSRLVAGERYASLDELVADQQAAGYLKTGYFGKHWPATVSEIKNDNDGIVFIRKDGTRHTYSKFGGYRMRMVRLRAGDKETIVVFRSQSKR